MAEERQQLAHLMLPSRAVAEDYRPRSAFPRLSFPERQVGKHGKRLLQQFDAVTDAAAELEATRERLGIGVNSGVRLEFESQDGFDLKIESLESREAGIELLNVRKVGQTTFATVQVPEGRLAYFIKRIEDYISKKTSGEKPQPKNRALVAGIENVRLAALDALWTDDPGLLPGNDEMVWWEVWLRQNPDSGDAEEVLKQAAKAFKLELSTERLVFPEHVVLAIQATKGQLSLSLAVLNSIAELRLAKVTADRYVELPLGEQVVKASDILSNSTFGESKVAVCLLDTGVNLGHPLLAPGLKADDAHAYDDSWGSDDHHGHGTEMAGLALYGDLLEMVGGGPQLVNHVLESVKILPPKGANPPHLYGSITISSVAKAEAAAADRKRVISMQVTADDRDKGRPSTWSAALDTLTSGYLDDRRRLLMVSAGNTLDANRHDYPANCQAEQVEDPGQSWNAVTVGAFTNKVTTTSKDYAKWKVVAGSGGLSPYSRTSSHWERAWPIKPEVVFEGGNCAIDPADGKAYEIDPLSLLTTHSKIGSRLFAATCMTSAATALAARFAARLQSRYPDLWPESIRALMIHSAEWTDALTAPFGAIKNKADREKVLRFCGYGVPDFERACWSADNELTLIAEDEIQPYDKVDGEYKTRHINFHKLPWPVSQLHDLAGTMVELRVTLSYFIEPNPGDRGWRGRYRYASHALRFEVRKAGESESDFKKRVNLAARAEEEMKDNFGGTDAAWRFGPNIRHRGSVHSDRWTGTAADLADHDLIAVYPVVGWWRERPHLDRWSRKARYSLVVSILSPSTEIDIYTPVKNQIEVAIPVEVGAGE